MPPQALHVCEETLEAQLRRLSLVDRAHLARVLLESLDDEPALHPEWLEEAEHRAAELVAGSVVAISAADQGSMPASASRSLLRRPVESGFSSTGEKIFDETNAVTATVSFRPDCRDRVPGQLSPGVIS